MASAQRQSIELRVNPAHSITTNVDGQTNSYHVVIAVGQNARPSIMKVTIPSTTLPKAKAASKAKITRTQLVGIVVTVAVVVILAVSLAIALTERADSKPTLREDVSAVIVNGTLSSSSLASLIGASAVLQMEQLLECSPFSLSNATVSLRAATTNGAVVVDGIIVAWGVNASMALVFTQAKNGSIEAGFSGSTQSPVRFGGKNDDDVLCVHSMSFTAATPGTLVFAAQMIRGNCDSSAKKSLFAATAVNLTDAIISISGSMAVAAAPTVLKSTLHNGTSTTWTMETSVPAEDVATHQPKLQSPVLHSACMRCTLNVTVTSLIRLRLDGNASQEIEFSAVGTLRSDDGVRMTGQTSSEFAGRVSIGAASYTVQSATVSTAWNQDVFDGSVWANLTALSSRRSAIVHPTIRLQTQLPRMGLKCPVAAMEVSAVPLLSHALSAIGSGDIDRSGFDGAQSSFARAVAATPLGGSINGTLSLFCGGFVHLFSEQASIQHGPFVSMRSILPFLRAIPGRSLRIGDTRLSQATVLSTLEFLRGDNSLLLDASIPASFCRMDDRTCLADAAIELRNQILKMDVSATLRQLIFTPAIAGFTDSTTLSPVALLSAVASARDMFVEAPFEAITSVGTVVTTHSDTVTTMTEALIDSRSPQANVSITNCSVAISTVPFVQINFGARATKTHSILDALQLMTFGHGDIETQVAATIATDTVFIDAINLCSFQEGNDASDAEILINGFLSVERLLTRMAISMSHTPNTQQRVLVAYNTTCGSLVHNLLEFSYSSRALSGSTSLGTLGSITVGVNATIVATAISTVAQSLNGNAFSVFLDLNTAVPLQDCLEGITRSLNTVSSQPIDITIPIGQPLSVVILVAAASAAIKNANASVVVNDVSVDATTLYNAIACTVNSGAESRSEYDVHPVPLPQLSMKLADVLGAIATTLIPNDNTALRWPQIPVAFVVGGEYAATSVGAISLLSSVVDAVQQLPILARTQIPIDSDCASSIALVAKESASYVTALPVVAITDINGRVYFLQTVDALVALAAVSIDLSEHCSIGATFGSAGLALPINVSSTCITADSTVATMEISNSTSLKMTSIIPPVQAASIGAFNPAWVSFVARTTTITAKDVSTVDVASLSIPFAMQENGQPITVLVDAAVSRARDSNGMLSVESVPQSQLIFQMNYSDGRGLLATPISLSGRVDTLGAFNATVGLRFMFSSGAIADAFVAIPTAVDGNGCFYVHAASEQVVLRDIIDFALTDGSLSQIPSILRPSVYTRKASFRDIRMILACESSSIFARGDVSSEAFGLNAPIALSAETMCDWASLAQALRSVGETYPVMQSSLLTIIASAIDTNISTLAALPAPCAYGSVHAPVGTIIEKVHQVLQSSPNVSSTITVCSDLLEGCLPIASAISAALVQMDAIPLLTSIRVQVARPTVIATIAPTDGWSPAVIPGASAGSSTLQGGFLLYSSRPADVSVQRYLPIGHNNGTGRVRTLHAGVMFLAPVGAPGTETIVTINNMFAGENKQQRRRRDAESGQLINWLDSFFDAAEELYTEINTWTGNETIPVIDIGSNARMLNVQIQVKGGQDSVSVAGQLALYAHGFPNCTGATATASKSKSAAKCSETTNATVVSVSGTASPSSVSLSGRLQEKLTLFTFGSTAATLEDGNFKFGYQGGNVFVDASGSMVIGALNVSISVAFAESGCSKYSGSFSAPSGSATLGGLFQDMGLGHVVDGASSTLKEYLFGWALNSLTVDGALWDASCEQFNLVAVLDNAALGTGASIAFRWSPASILLVVVPATDINIGALLADTGLTNDVAAISLTDVAFVYSSIPSSVNPSTVIQGAPDVALTLVDGFNLYAVADFGSAGSAAASAAAEMTSTTLVTLQGYIGVGNSSGFAFSGVLGAQPIAIASGVSVSSLAVTIQDIEPYFSLNGDLTITPTQANGGQDIDTWQIAVSMQYGQGGFQFAGFTEANGTAPIAMIPVASGSGVAIESVSIDGAYVSSQPGTPAYFAFNGNISAVYADVSFALSLTIDNENGSQVVLNAEATPMSSTGWSLASLLADLVGSSPIASDFGPIGSIVGDIEVMNVGFGVSWQSSAGLSFFVSGAIEVDGAVMTFGLQVGESTGGAQSTSSSKWYYAVSFNPGDALVTISSAIIGALENDIENARRSTNDAASSSLGPVQSLLTSGASPAVIITSLLAPAVMAHSPFLGKAIGAVAEALVSGFNVAGTLSLTGDGVLADIGSATGFTTVVAALSISAGFSLPVTMSATFEAGPNGITVVPGFMALEDASLSITLAKTMATSTFDISAKVLITTDSQQFDMVGSLGFNAVGITVGAELLAPGIYSPFGINNVQLYSADASVTLAYEGLEPTAFGLAGTVDIGPPADTDISAAIRYNVAAGQAAFAFSLTNFDLDTMVKTFYPSASVPSWLDVSIGSASFSVNAGPTFEWDGTTFPAGFNAAIANASFFFIDDFSATFSLTPQMVSASASIDPFTIGDGLFSVRGFPNPDAQPSFALSLPLAGGSIDDASFAVDGSVTLLGLTEYANISVSATGMSVDAGLSFFVFSANVEFTAVFGESNGDGFGPIEDFSFLGTFQDDLMTYISQKLPAMIESARQSAESSFQGAIDTVQSWQSAIAGIDNLITLRTQQIDAVQNDIEATLQGYILAVQSAENTVSNLNSDINSIENTISNLHWWQWVDGQGEFYSAEVATLWCSEKAAEGALELAQLVLEGAEDIVSDLPLAALDPVILALQLSRDAVEAFLNLATGVLEVAEGAVSGLLLLAEKILEAIGNAINIQSVTIQGSLSQLKAGQLPSITIDLILFGKQYTPTLSVDLSDIESFLQSLVKWIVNEFTP